MTERAADPPPEALAWAHEFNVMWHLPGSDLELSILLDRFAAERVETYAAALREIALLPDVSADEAPAIAMRALNWKQVAITEPPASTPPEISPSPLQRVVSILHRFRVEIGNPLCIEELSGLCRELHAEGWNAALAAIEASGTHLVVPVEPTEAMLDGAGHAFADAAFAHVPGDIASVNRPFRRFYRAMLAARPRDAAPTDSPT